MAKGESKHYHYQYESTARAYPEKVDPLRIPSSPTSRPHALPKRKIDVRFGMQMSICGMVLFICSFFYIHSYATLRIKQMELRNLKDQKIMVTNNITEMQAKIDKKLDLSAIEEKATRQLGMTKPYAHQIVYIELPEKSYTTYQQTK